MDWPFLTQGAGFAVAVALTAACTNRDLQLPEPAIAAHASPSCDQATPTPAYYFPGAAFRWLSLHIEGTTEKPAQILEAMREPALSCGVQPESYRLVWIPALSGWMTDGGGYNGPTAIRFNRAPDAWRATAVRLAGSINRQEIYRHERVLTPEDGQELLREVDAFGLWSKEDFAYNAGVRDGAIRVIEGRRGTAYHPALLHIADDGAVGQLYRVFVRLAGIDEREMRPSYGVEK